MAPASKLEIAVGRVWLRGDVTVVEETFRATPAAAPGVPYYPGADADGKCPPPDPGKYVKWRGSDDVHWHYVDWNQAPPPSCWVHPVFRTGPNPGPLWRETPR